MDSMMISYFINIAVGSLLFLAIILAIISIARRMAASTRYWILIGILLGILILPVLSAIVPSWNLPDPGSIFKTKGIQVHTTKSNDAENGLTRVKNLPVDHDKPDVVKSEQNGSADKFGLILSIYSAIFPYSLLSIWFIGAFLIGFRNFIRWQKTRTLVANSRPIDHSRAIEIIAAVKKEFGIKKPITLSSNNMFPLVMVWGFLRPHILLPHDYRSWPDEKLKAVFSHEMAHIVRYDNFFIIHSLIASALYWFNPLVWVLIRKLNLTREASCDDYVLNRGVKSSAYAAYLMEIIQKADVIKKPVISPVMATYTSNIKRRLNHVLNDRIKRKTVRLSAAYLIVILTLCMVLPFSAINVWSYSDRDATTLDNARTKAAIAQKRKDSLLVELKQYEDAAAKALAKRESSLSEAVKQHENAEASSLAREQANMSEAVRQYDSAKALALSEEKANLSKAVKHYESALAQLAQTEEDSIEEETPISAKLDSLSQKAGLFSAQHYKELKKQGPPKDEDLLQEFGSLSGSTTYRYYSDGTYSYEDDGSISLGKAAIYDDTKNWKFEANDVTLYKEDDDVKWEMEAPDGYIRVTVEVDGMQLEYKVSDFALGKSMFMKKRDFYIDGKSYPFGDQQMEEFKLIVNEVFQLINW